jgi:hypothetical protein
MRIAIASANAEAERAASAPAAIDNGGRSFTAAIDLIASAGV